MCIVYSIPRWCIPPPRCSAPPTPPRSSSAPAWVFPPLGFSGTQSPPTHASTLQRHCPPAQPCRPRTPAQDVVSHRPSCPPPRLPAGQRNWLEREQLPLAHATHAAQAYAKAAFVQNLSLQEAPLLAAAAATLFAHLQTHWNAAFPCLSQTISQAASLACRPTGSRGEPRGSYTVTAREGKGPTFLVAIPQQAPATL